MIRKQGYPGNGEVARREELAELVGRLSDDGLDRRERGRLLARLTAALATGARSAGARTALTGRWLTDVVSDLAPHVPVRDLATLRAHHDGRSGDELAQALVRSASLVAAGIGAAGGTLAAVEMAAPPTLLAAPVQIAAETLAVVAVELKLVAELHVVYGREPSGSRLEVGAAHLTAWVTRKGLDLSAPGPSLGALLGTAARRQLRSRLLRRAGRNVTTLAPFLAGAAAGAELNRRETRRLGEKLIADLRQR